MTVAETVLGWMYEDQTALGLRVYSGPETRTRSDEAVVAQAASPEDGMDVGHLTESRGDDNLDLLARPGFTSDNDGLVKTNPKPDPVTAVRGDEDISPTVSLHRPLTSTRGDEGFTAVVIQDPPLTHSREDEDLVLVLAGPDPQPEETKARGDD